jgi:hypothetical protein
VNTSRRPVIADASVKCLAHSELTSLSKRIAAAHKQLSRLMAPAGLFVLQRTGNHSAGISCTAHELFCPWAVLCGTWSETSVATSKLTQFLEIPRHRTLSYLTLCLSWLLHCRVWKSLRDLRITLYILI